MSTCRNFIDVLAMAICRSDLLVVHNRSYPKNVSLKHLQITLSNKVDIIETNIFCIYINMDV